MTTTDPLGTRSPNAIDASCQPDFSSARSDRPESPHHRPESLLPAANALPRQSGQIAPADPQSASPTRSHDGTTSAPPLTVSHKTVVQGIRLSPLQMDRLHAKAAAARLSPADWLRARIDEPAGFPRTKNPATLGQMSNPGETMPRKTRRPLNERAAQVVTDHCVRLLTDAPVHAIVRDGGRAYTVRQSFSGRSWSCSCWHIFADCDHIRATRILVSGPLALT